MCTCRSNLILEVQTAEPQTVDWTSTDWCLLLEGLKSFPATSQRKGLKAEVIGRDTAAFDFENERTDSGDDEIGLSRCGFKQWREWLRVSASGDMIGD